MNDDMAAAAVRQCAARAAAGVLVLFATFLTPAAAQDFSFGRRLFLDKAECSYCHGWAGDGAGAPQSPGRAANLRQSQLGRDQLITVIACGVPGTSMPYFDDLAYSDRRCFGMTEAELGSRVLPSSAPLQRREIEVLADYLMAKVIKRGPITREECTETLGERVRSCDEYRAGR